MNWRRNCGLKENMWEIESLAVDSAAATRILRVPPVKEAAGPVCVPEGDLSNTTGISDESLIAGVVLEDREALAMLFRRHYRLVHWIARKILRNVAEAEDLAQDVFLHIVRKCHLYNSAKGTARSWIVRTTYYQALNRKEYLEDRHYYTTVNPNGRGVEELAAPGVNGYDHS